MLAALQEGRIRGAVLDVFEQVRCCGSADAEPTVTACLCGLAVLQQKSDERAVLRSPSLLNHLCGSWTLST